MAYIFEDSNLWQLLQEVIKSMGYCLYDAEHTYSSLKIYVVPAEFGSFPGSKKPSVGMDDCVEISKRLSVLLSVEAQSLGLDFENLGLEVASPGINRRLRLSKHFQEAIGERIKLKFINGDKKDILVGTLVAFDDSGIFVQLNGSSEQKKFSLEEIKETFVNFDFNFKIGKNKKVEGKKWEFQ